MIKHKSWVMASDVKSSGTSYCAHCRVTRVCFVMEKDNLGRLVVTSGLKFWSLLWWLPIKTSGERRLLRKSGPMSCGRLFLAFTELRVSFPVLQHRPGFHAPWRCVWAGSTAAFGSCLPPHKLWCSKDPRCLYSTRGVLLKSVWHILLLCWITTRPCFKTGIKGEYCKV